MEVVYEEKCSPTSVDQRLRLKSVSEIKPGDRLQRNGDPIVSVFELDESYLFVTRTMEQHLDKVEPICVWRIADAP